MTRTLAFALLSMLAAFGCTPVPDFAEESLIDRPRVLAIVAEPPETAPGVTSELSLLLALPEEAAVRVQWSVCGAFFTMFRGSQYGDQPTDQGCRGGLSAPLAPLDAEGRRAALPGVLTARLFDDLALAAASFGAALPEATVEAIRERVGLALVVEAEVSIGERRLRAVKRVLVSDNPRPHSNPDPPHFDVLQGDVALAEIVGDPAQPLRCVAASGELPVIDAGSEVELAPRVGPRGDEALDAGTDVGTDAGVDPGVDPDAGPDAGEPWLESYQVLNARGELEPRRERAFYSWFSTAGRFSENVTRSPLRNTLWRAPGTPGRYPLWLVVRDGHGGTSACQLELEVR